MYPAQEEDDMTEATKRTKKTMPDALRKSLAEAGFKQEGGPGGGGGMARTEETVNGVKAITAGVGRSKAGIIFVVLPNVADADNLPGGKVVKVKLTRTVEGKGGKVTYPALKNAVNAYAKDHGLTVFSLPGTKGMGYVLTSD